MFPSSHIFLPITLTLCFPDLYFHHLCLQHICVSHFPCFNLGLCIIQQPPPPHPRSYHSTSLPSHPLHPINSCFSTMVLFNPCPSSLHVILLLRPYPISLSFFIPLHHLSPSSLPIILPFIPPSISPLHLLSSLTSVHSSFPFIHHIPSAHSLILSLHRLLHPFSSSVLHHPTSCLSLIPLLQPSHPSPPPSTSMVPSFMPLLNSSSSS